MESLVKLSLLLAIECYTGRLLSGESLMIRNTAMHRSYIMSFVCAAAISGAIAHESVAVTISFDEPSTNVWTEQTDLSSISFPVISFIDAILVKPGEPVVGFHGSSQGGSGGADDVGTGNTMSAPDNINFEQVTWLFDVPVTNLSFDVIDIEAGGSHIVETFVAELLDETNVLLGSAVIVGGDAGTGDGSIFMQSFPGVSGISKVQVTVTPQVVNPLGGTGWAVDNITFTPVPEPQTLVYAIHAAFALVPIALCRCRRQS